MTIFYHKVHCLSLFLLTIVCTLNLQVIHANPDFAQKQKEIEKSVNSQAQTLLKEWHQLNNGTVKLQGREQQSFETLQSALNASKENDRIILSEGKFLVSKVLKLPTHNVFIQGQGEKTVLMPMHCFQEQPCAENEWVQPFVIQFSSAGSSRTYFKDLILALPYQDRSDASVRVVTARVGILRRSGYSHSLHHRKFFTNYLFIEDKSPEKSLTINDLKLQKISPEEVGRVARSEHLKPLSKKAKAYQKQTRSELKKENQVRLKALFPDWVLTSSESVKYYKQAKEELQKGRPLTALYFIYNAKKTSPWMYESRRQIAATITTFAGANYACGIHWDTKEPLFVNQFWQGVRTTQYKDRGLLSYRFSKIGPSCQIRIVPKGKISAKEVFRKNVYYKHRFGYRDKSCLIAQDFYARQKAKRDAEDAKFWKDIWASTASQMSSFPQSSPIFDSINQRRRAMLTAGRGSKGNKYQTRYLESYNSVFQPRARERNYEKKTNDKGVHTKPSTASSPKKEAKNVKDKVVSEDWNVAKTASNHVKLRGKDFAGRWSVEHLFMNWNPFFLKKPSRITTKKPASLKNPKKCEKSYDFFNKVRTAFTYQGSAQVSYIQDGLLINEVMQKPKKEKITMDVYVTNTDSSTQLVRKSHMLSLFAGREFIEEGYKEQTRLIGKIEYEKYKKAKTDEDRFEALLALNLVEAEEYLKKIPGWEKLRPYPGIGANASQIMKALKHLSSKSQ